MADDKGFQNLYLKLSMALHRSKITETELVSRCREMKVVNFALIFLNAFLV